jgi:hypothetical protein
MMPEIIFYFQYVVVVVVLFLIIYLSYKQRKREKEMNDFISKNGFTIETADTILSLLGGGIKSSFWGDEMFFGPDLRIFNVGRSKKIKNSFSINFNNSKIYFFNYNYTTGGGKSSTTYILTIAVFKSAKNIPQFYLRPERFFDKISEFFGYNDIDFKHRPEFSKKYYLKSNDEYSVINIFNDELLEFFETHPDYYVESNNGYIAIYRYEFVEPEKYPDFIEDVKKILTLINA